jgi:hypothetical protein
MIKTLTVPTITKLVLGGGAAGLLGIATLGASATPVFAANTPTAASPAKGAHKGHDNRQDRRQIERVLFEAEADVLGLSPEQLRDDIRKGESVSQLAADKGLTKDQFADRLATAAKPGLDKLVDSKQITADQEQKVLAAIRAGHIPHWDAPKHHKTK